MRFPMTENREKACENAAEDIGDPDDGILYYWVNNRLDMQNVRPEEISPHVFVGILVKKENEKHVKLQRVDYEVLCFLSVTLRNCSILHAMDHRDAPKILNKNRLNQNLRAFIERLPNGEIHWVTLQMYDNDGNPTKKYI